MCLDVHFPNNNDVEYIFMCAFVYLLGEMSVQIHYLCFYYCVVSVLIYFRYKFLFIYLILIIFLHSAGYLFTFLIMSFVAQVFSSDVVQFIFFVFVVCNVFDVISKKPFPNLRHDYFYLHFLPRVL